MKRCKNCNALADDQTMLCTSCGSADLEDVNAAQPREYSPVAAPAGEIVNPNGNILAGIVGAFLFSIIGGALYFLLYQMDIIAGICGLVIFILANFGYGLFAKPGDKNSLAGLICAVVATIVMIYAAEYISVAYILYDEFKNYYDITFFDAVKAMPEFLADSEVSAAVSGDLVFAYVFGFLATIKNIVGIVKERKQK